jgi:glyoxylase-like metal-dependent hydrolase (beta-lactamase superfamily II)
VTAPVALPQIDVAVLPLGVIATNCMIVHAVGSRQAVVIDPGGDVDRLATYLADRDLEPEGVLVTHGHFDHIGGVAATARLFGVPVWMGEVDAPALESPERFAVPGYPEVEPCQVDHRLAGGERIEIAGITFEVLNVPGHSPGHVAFVVEGDTPHCFIGDVIFRGSVGRTDLPFADAATLLRTLRMLAVRLDPGTRLWPGHGEPTTMESELAGNPFLRGI